MFVFILSNMKLTVIEAQKLSELMTLIIEYSENGWQVIGGISNHCPTPNNSFSQTMIAESFEKIKASNSDPFSSSKMIALR
jgi:hypothetical protein